MEQSHSQLSIAPFLPLAVVAGRFEDGKDNGSLHSALSASSPDPPLTPSPCWLWSQAVPRVAVTTTTCTSAAAAALVAAALILTVSPVFAADEEDAAGRIKAAVCASNPTSELCVKDSFKPVGPQPRS